MLVIYYMGILYLGQAGEINTDVYWRKLPNSITYEASIPLIYTTKWETGDNAGHSSTSLMDCGENGKSLNCQFVKEIERLSNLYDGERSMLRQLIEGQIGREQGVRRKRALDFIASSFEWCCGFATQHKFKKLAAYEQQLAE
ncbi:hypothetical protein Zmor_003578 [Zophobas morio]|uniref:Uncharacterized protein n=1 Tax=Zophobas morio TaxID=2755281 RepID=A0AA38M267_9CUCU|nr:hypothetical protein Zmor_003578 [Zophobas morio]